MPRLRQGPPESQLQSLDRAISALELFTASRPTMNLGEIADALGVGRSTAHRVLSTLEARGYISYSTRSREYSLGLAAIRLGNVALSSLNLRTTASPYLRRLATELEESAFLLVVEGNSAVVIDYAESGHPLRLTLQPGMPWPLHAGASNKVLLAHLPQEQIEAYLAGPLTPVTGQTPTDRAVLREELVQIRAQGYAWTVGEITPDVAAFSVPILDGPLLLGGLSVAGPYNRLRHKPHAVELLQQAARGISRELGSRV